MAFSRCPRCDEIVGAYEPIRVLLFDGSCHRGSRLTLRDLLAARGGLALHERCYDGAEAHRAPLGPRQAPG